MKLAVVGAGVAGRWLAELAGQRGFTVDLFDDGVRKASSVAAGLLSPFCELDSASALVHRLGRESLPRWRDLAGDFFFQQTGTLVVAASSDLAELARLERRVQKHHPGSYRVPVERLEPELSPRFRDGLYFAEEGQVDARGALAVLARSARWRGRAREIAPFLVDGERYDWVADCRGLAAREQWTGLRGVRGEIARVRAPEVALHRPVRLAHPRFALYVAPRPDHRFVIGATSLESEDEGPPRVRSALELLSAAYALHPGFGEATIEELSSALRPALPDHEPRLQVRPGLLRLNGLYRHGYLVAPKVCEIALRGIADDQFESELWRQEAA